MGGGGMGEMGGGGKREGQLANIQPCFQKLAADNPKLLHILKSTVLCTFVGKRKIFVSHSFLLYTYKASRSTYPSVDKLSAKLSSAKLG